MPGAISAQAGWVVRKHGRAPHTSFVIALGTSTMAEGWGDDEIKASIALLQSLRAEHKVVNLASAVVPRVDHDAIGEELAVWRKKAVKRSSLSLPRHAQVLVIGLSHCRCSC